MVTLGKLNFQINTFLDDRRTKKHLFHYFRSTEAQACILQAIKYGGQEDLCPSHIFLPGQTNGDGDSTQTGSISTV